jgi:hypothetical protein
MDDEMTMYRRRIRLERFNSINRNRAMLVKFVCDVLFWVRGQRHAQ